jgi:uncharacterized protein YkwD
MLIISIIMGFVLRLSVFGLACVGFVGQGFAGSDETSGSAVVREMNLARENPAAYATYLEELRSNFHGNLLVLPGRIPLRTKEGVRAVDEAIRFLRNAAPQPPLNFSPGMSRAAADHCAEQAGGGMSHSGRGGSNTGDRINRYGVWGGTWGENLSCGQRGARETVLALIVDDGLGARKHRKNIFSPSFGYAGAAIGQHAQYHTICSIEFAGDYVEQGQVAKGGRSVERPLVRRETLFATNGL